MDKRAGLEWHLAGGWGAFWVGEQHEESGDVGKTLMCLEDSKTVSVGEEPLESSAVDNVARSMLWLSEGLLKGELGVRSRKGTPKLEGAWVPRAAHLWPVHILRLFPGNFQALLSNTGGCLPTYSTFLIDANLMSRNAVVFIQ